MRRRTPSTSCSRLSSARTCRALPAATLPANYDPERGRGRPTSTPRSSGPTTRPSNRPWQRSLGTAGRPLGQLPIVDFNTAMDDLRAANPEATSISCSCGSSRCRVTPSPRPRPGPTSRWTGSIPTTRVTRSWPTLPDEDQRGDRDPAGPTVPVDALSGIPTYGVPMTEGLRARYPTISPEAARRP